MTSQLQIQQAMNNALAHGQYQQLSCPPEAYRTDIPHYQTSRPWDASADATLRYQILLDINWLF